MKLFIIIAGLLMLGACTGKTEGFVLKGELEGAPDDHWVFLTNTGQTHYYDSTRLKCLRNCKKNFLPVYR